MVKKQKKIESKRQPTKRQLSKWRRQRQIQRVIIALGALFFIFIAVYIGYGYYTEQVKPLRQPVIRVNDTVFDMDYYVKLLDFLSQGQEPANISAMTAVTTDFLVQGELIRQKAGDLGVNVTEAEIDDGLASLQLPDDKVYTDFVAAKLLSDKLMRDHFDTKVPTVCEQVKVQAMLLESKKVAAEIKGRLEAGDDFLNIAEKASREAITKEKKGDLGWLPKGFTDLLLPDLADSKLEDIAFSLEPGTISEPTYDGSVMKDMGYWILKVTEKDAKKGSRVSGILLGSFEEAEEIRVKLAAGEDFGALAKQYSQHVSGEEGGELGWTRGGLLSRTIVGFAEQLEPDEVSKPVVDESVWTRGGYWLVKVVERDANRQLDDETRQILKARLFGEWVDELRGDSLIENYLTEEQKVWAVEWVLRLRGE